MNPEKAGPVFLCVLKKQVVKNRASGAVDLR